MSTNLNDNVNESFPFEVGDHQYKMIYPTLEEVEELQTIIKNSEAKKEKGEATDDTAIMDWMYGYISPINPESPPIGEVLKKQNIRVIAKFQEMIQSEFGLGD